MTEQGESRNVVNERQAELGQVRGGISGPWNPRTPAPPTVPDMHAPAAPEPEPARELVPDPVRTLLHVVSTVWYLWGGRP
jgi:hypothetical protein